MALSSGSRIFSGTFSVVVHSSADTPSYPLPHGQVLAFETLKLERVLEFEPHVVVVLEGDVISSLESSTS